MQSVFVISSFVAGSNVGGGLAMKVLPQLGHEVSLLPTTMLGRHPGWGAPGGGVVSTEMFADMMEGLEANDLPAHCDAVITGYFGDPAQVKLAAELIERSVKGRAPVIIDPILGDEGKGLYVGEAVSEAMITHLVPLADAMTPNAWELAFLKDRVAPERLGIIDVYETSAREGDQIGIHGPDGGFSGADILPETDVPNGVGDLTTLLIADCLVSGRNVSLSEIIGRLLIQIGRSDAGEISAIL